MRKQSINAMCIYNHGHNILELYSDLVNVQFATSKTKLDISHKKLIYELLHELPDNLRLKKLGNIRKISN